MQAVTVRSLAAAIAVVLLASLAALPRATATHTLDYFDLDALPAPAVTGKKLIDDLAAFNDAHPYRLTGGPTEQLAGEFFRSQAASLGYETAVVGLPVTGGTPGVPVLKAVTATKRGTTNPDEWILFVGHYDTVPQTIWGTYDNAAGTMLMLQLARALANVPTNRTIVFAWYNGEEEGLLASQRHAAMVKASGQKIAAVLGFDMVGIGYPVANPSNVVNCMCLYHGQQDGPWAAPLLRHVNFDFLDFPEGRGTVDIAGRNIRNSDERSFEQQGYRVLRWTGMRRAADYPEYHRPNDTLETMISVAGGREFLEQGTLNTLKSAYYTALTVDNHPPAADIAVSVSGLTAALDGSGSTDADAAPSGYAWDLGDGATAEGATVTHTFAAPGTYTVTLEVADNLWPAVTRSVSVDVTVG